MRLIGATILLSALTLSGCASVGTTTETSPSTVAVAADFAKATKGLEKRSGLLDLYVDEVKHKVWLEVPTASGTMGEFLYAEGLRSGLGSNPVGLDRGQLGEARWVQFEVHGGRFVIRQPNLSFRALSDDPLERKAVRESFASSVLWSAPVQFSGGGDKGLVDLTSFLVRDAHSIVRQLKRTGQGGFALDAERSLVLFDEVLALPENLEFEALLTFTSSEPGPHVRQTAPDPTSVSLVLHQSFVKAPEAGYQPRVLDPRAGSFGISFSNYAADLDQPIATQWLVRHRLEKVDPAAERSTVVEPIVYYVDSGVPEPVRSALVEGASWWADAFDAAGFIDAFKVEVLPEGVHPLDSRYNVIQWVHRSTRGWSYGGGLVDPRTGEMIKGHVSLGSLRVRQDRILFEGLLGSEKSGSGDPDDPVQLALARIRQLSAHEVGHTLGFNHNFSASSYGRESVMDYPAPWIRMDDSGEIDVSQSYASGIGEWDKHTVRFAYSQFPPGGEAAGLEAIVREGHQQGLRFLSDQDARPLGAAVASASLWDNGEDAIEALREVLSVRRRALADFGPSRLGKGQALAQLEEVLAVVYFLHRYQLEATVKLVGGLDYEYAFPGLGKQRVEPVAATRQREALAVVLETLSPEALDLPESVLTGLMPRVVGDGPNRELFERTTGALFDALSAAQSSADFTIELLLTPGRANRLVELHRRNGALPGYSEVLSALVAHVFDRGTDHGTSESGRLAEVRRTVQSTLVKRLLHQMADPGASDGVRSRTLAVVEELHRSLAANSGLGASESSSPESAHRLGLERMIQMFLDSRIALERPAPNAASMPPGSPIGASSLWAQDCDFVAHGSN